MLALNQRWVMDNQIILSLLVDNVAGVLSRIAGLFSRRAYNIESLTVGETTNPRISRMTIVSRGDEHILMQIAPETGRCAGY